MFNIVDYVDVEQVLDDLRYDLQHQNIYLLKDSKSVNNNIMVTCPYHANGQESHPSMGISLKEHNKGTCHCFTCGTTRSLPEMISNAFGKNDAGIYGVKWLHQKYDFVSEENRQPVNVLPNEKQVDLTPRPWESYNQYIVEEVPYLTNRGINKYVQQWFKIGFDPSSRHVIFPMVNETGQLMYLQSRSIDVKFFFIEENAPKQYVLFGLDKVHYMLNRYEGPDFDNSKVYVVESIIDAMYLWSYGKMAVATSQATPTEQQLELLKKLPVKTIVAAQDNDEWGWKGAYYMRKQLKDKLVYRFNFKTNNYYKDINDLPPSEIISEENLSLVW